MTEQQKKQFTRSTRGDLRAINEYLELADIEEIAEQDLDRWDDYAEQVNEKIKEEK